MAKSLPTLALFAAVLSGGTASAQTTAPVDDDGFKQPLRELKFNPGLNQREFER